MAAVEQLITDNLDIWSSAVKSKSSAGRGTGKKIELYGIKKLRELILELAVRGLLVPQDPNDEPASELLNRISIERNKLIASGKLKRNKSSQPILAEEIPFDPPLGWELIRIADVADVKGGKRLPAGHTFSDEVTPHIYIRVTDMKNGSINTDGLVYLHPETQKIISQYVISKNDIYITIAGTIGQVGIVPPELDGMNLTENAARIIFSVVDKYWFQKSLSSNFVKNQFDEKKNQLAQPKLALHRILSSLIYLPPVAEQHRIVAKVDELMALCDKLEQQQESSISAHQALVQTLLGALTNGSDREGFAAAWARIAEHFDTLFTTEWSIEQLKQAILQLAVMGKLVPQNPADEPASELLKKIAAEKAKLIKDGKIKKQKPLPPISEEEKSFELPEGWELVRLEDVVDIQGGITKGRKLTGRKTVTIPYLSVANVQRSFLDLSLVKEIDIPEEEMAKYQVLMGDLLITEGGDWDKVGRTAIWRDEIPYVAHQNHVFKARVFVPELSEVWLEKYLNSSFSRDYFAGSSKQTTNLASINKTQLRGCLIAVPPAKEQRQIIVKVEKLMALCDTLKTSVNNVQTIQLYLADVMTEQALG